MITIILHPVMPTHPAATLNRALSLQSTAPAVEKARACTFVFYMCVCKWFICGLI